MGRSVLDKQYEKGRLAIFEHFRGCSGDPERWDARKVAWAMLASHFSVRVGGEPFSRERFALYCTRGVTLEDVWEMATEGLEHALDAIQAEVGEVPLPSPEEMDLGRQVYFIQAKDGGPIKIGKTNDVAARLQALQAGSPVPLRILACQGGGHPLESALHRRFAADRLHGEWFQASEALLGYIKGLEAEV